MMLLKYTFLSFFLSTLCPIQCRYKNKEKSKQENTILPYVIVGVAGGFFLLNKWGALQANNFSLTHNFERLKEESERKDVEKADEVKASIDGLMSAAYVGDKRLINIHVQDGIDIKSRDVEGRTALHWAAWGGHSSIIQHLVFHGLSLKDRDNKGNNARSYALRGNHKIIAERLAFYERGENCIIL